MDSGKYNYILENLFGNNKPEGTPAESYECFLKSWGVRNPFGDLELWNEEPEEITEDDIEIFYAEYEERNGVKL